MTPTSPAAPQVRLRPEGGGGFAPALGGGSGANRAAGGPEDGQLGAARPFPQLSGDRPRAGVKRPPGGAVGRCRCWRTGGRDKTGMRT